MSIGRVVARVMESPALTGPAGTAAPTAAAFRESVEGLQRVIARNQPDDPHFALNLSDDLDDDVPFLAYDARRAATAATDAIGPAAATRWLRAVDDDISIVSRSGIDLYRGLGDASERAATVTSAAERLGRAGDDLTRMLADQAERTARQRITLGAATLGGTTAGVGLGAGTYAVIDD